MNSEDLQDFKLVSDPQISPDGKKILFTLTTVNEDLQDYSSHIWIILSLGGDPTQFTYGDGKDTNPRWSPNGEKILFLSTCGTSNTKQLWVMPANGGEARRVCSTSNAVEKPMWSPDGSRILFLSRIRTEEPYREGSDVKIIKKLVYKFNDLGFFHDTRRHLFVVDSDGGSSKQLTEGDFDVVSMDWSPNGEDVSLVANITEDTDHTLIKDIWLLSTKGDNLRKITDGKWQIDAVSWSPDGDKIAFVGREILKTEYIKQYNPNIMILPSKGKEVRNLTKSFDQWVWPFHSCIAGWAEAPKWSPDSTKLRFMANEEGSLHVFEVNENQDVHRVTEGKMVVGTFSMSEDWSRMAFNATESLRLAEVWIHEKDGSKRITDINIDLEKRPDVSKPEEFKFRASDGVQIQGWILKPKDFEEGKKYATILQIHGGPYTAYGYKFTAAEHEFQVLADNGYTVVFTNPRGSLGYGEKFSSEQAGNYGDRDYKDLMEAMDLVIENFPFVDEDRLGVTGGSYGGWMTNWIVGHTDRFKAAVTCRSISNLFNLIGASDIGAMEWLPKHSIGLGKYPWDEPKRYLEKSPIMYVNNITTPLLIIHSDKDLDCTIDQAEHMFGTLKKLKKEVELVIFPGENHNLSRTGKPIHRIERLEHILRWFNKYLK